MFALNAPYNGGTHLPDITVCTPVFDDAGETILFWVASRGHHADIGGDRAGLDDARARPTIHEEGVYIDNFLLVERGRFRETELYELLTSGPWPARNPMQNVNDLKAQIAANEKGARGAAPHGRAFSASRPSRPTWATCRTTPTRACGA